MTEKRAVETLPVGALITADEIAPGWTAPAVSSSASALAALAALRASDSLTMDDISEVVSVIYQLLNCLPDNDRWEDESWQWCWNELSGEAQEKVKQARRRAWKLFVSMNVYDG